MNQSQVSMETCNSSKNPCTFPGCPCEDFTTHKWVHNRCLCFHKIDQHSNTNLRSRHSSEPQINPMVHESINQELPPLSRAASDAGELIRSSRLSQDNGQNEKSGESQAEVFPDEAQENEDLKQASHMLQNVSFSAGIPKSYMHDETSDEEDVNVQIDSDNDQHAREHFDSSPAIPENFEPHNDHCIGDHSAVEGEIPNAENGISFSDAMNLKIEMTESLKVEDLEPSAENPSETIHGENESNTELISSSKLQENQASEIIETDKIGNVELASEEAENPEESVLDKKESPPSISEGNGNSDVHKERVDCDVDVEKSNKIEPPTLEEKQTISPVESVSTSVDPKIDYKVPEASSQPQSTINSDVNALRNLSAEIDDLNDKESASSKKTFSISNMMGALSKKSRPICGAMSSPSSSISYMGANMDKGTEAIEASSTALLDYVERKSSGTTLPTSIERLNSSPLADIQQFNDFKKTPGDEIQEQNAAPLTLPDIIKLESGSIFTEELKGKELNSLDKFKVGKSEFAKMKRVFIKYAEAEREFANRITQIIFEESHTSLSTSASLESTYEKKVDLNQSPALMYLFNSLRAKSSFHNLYSTQLFDQLVHSTARHESDISDLFKQIENHVLAMRGNLATCMERCERYKIKSNKYYAQFLALENGKRSRRTKNVKKDEEVVKKLEAYLVSYDDSVKSANAYLDKVNNLYSPLLLNQLQFLEEKRIIFMKTELRHFQELSISMMKKELSNLSHPDGLELLNDVIDVVNNVKMFSEEVKREAKKQEASGIRSTLYSPMKIDLPEPIDSIKNRLKVYSSEMAKFQSSTQPTKISSRKLSMNKKSSTEPPKPAPEVLPLSPPKQDLESPFKAPKILMALKRAVEDLGGLQTQGIFRTNGDYNEINDRLKYLAEKSDCNVTFTSVHSAAGALRRYLKNYYEPIVPLDFSNDVLEVGDLLLSTEEDQRAIGVQNLQKKIYDKLPERSQHLIQCLIRIIRDVACEGNVELTKMNFEGLSLIFGPLIVGMGDGLDANAMMKMSKLGSTFVETWAMYLDTSGYSIEEEELAKSTVIEPKKPYDQWIRAPIH